MGTWKKAQLACATMLMSAWTVTPAGADSLGQAIADAYRNNPQLEAQRAQLRAVDEQVIQAASPYRLNLGINGTFAYDQQRQRNFLDNFERVSNRRMGVSVSASQILLNGGRTAAAVSAAEATVFSGRERLREVENFILLEVVDSYVSVRRDTLLVAIQQRSVDSYSRQVQQAQARERAGDLTRTDIAQATAQLEIIRTQLLQSQANLEASRSRFAAVVGRNPGVLDPEPQLPGIPGSLDLAYRVAENESPTLWQTIFNERAAKAQISAQRAERNPILSVTGSYGYVSPDSYQTRDLGRAISGAATVTMPLLSQGIIGSRVRAAIAGQQQAQFLVEATRRSVDQQVLTSWNQTISSRDQVVAGERGVTAAEAALEGVRRGFAEGFRSNFEVLDSEQRLLNAQIIVATANYTRYVNQANLLAYMGRLQASLIVQAAPEYDETANLAEQRRHQFGPFQTVLQPIDKALRVPNWSERSRPAPLVPAATDANVRASTTPPPEGALGTALPVTADARPPLPDPDSAPVR
ncbi:outer membrane protein [Sphingomonas gellani]|uniref:Outer membrane protein n=1 Tax=Sphingomonas gellani TaxID=1166340 RepID=A0A1H8HWC3_9SPHN|nr:TolC family outer membrane protein [Sphingomonas gellani]SEN60008.1 outer membrane protein [Sphingomonas gellani]